MNIHDASRNGNTEAVLLLLERGSDINARDGDSRTALHLALSAGNNELARVLLSRGATADSTALRIVIYRADLSLTAELLGVGVDPNSAHDGLTPLILACGLLQDSSGTPLKFCSANFGFLRHEEEQAFRLSLPAQAAFSIAELLLESGAQIDSCGLRGLTPLHSAALANNTEIITVLLAKGADATIRDRSGETPRGRAAQANRKEAAALLRDHRTP